MTAPRLRIIRTASNTAGGFLRGSRVELPPHMDAWMMGDRYGAIVGFGRIERDDGTETAIARVKMDKTARVLNAPLAGIKSP